MAGTGVSGIAAAAAMPASPLTQVELSISCRNLKNKDTFSKSDPMAVLFIKDFGKPNFSEVGRTEVVRDSLNPDFVTKFVVSYYFEVVQTLKFQIYDSDSASTKLESHDFLGQCDATLGELVSSGKLERSLLAANGIKNGSLGQICVRAEEVSKCNDLLRLKFSAKGLDKKDLFGKSDPYLVFYRCNEDSTYTAVHKTEVVKKNLNPNWTEFTISAQALCNGDYDRSIKVECYDWDSDGSHDFIGMCQTNARELVKGPTKYDLVNPKKKSSKKGYKNSGVLNLQSCKVEQLWTFLDYIQRGVQLNFTVAIDFTQSNGHPTNPSSLHYINPYGLNQYATALLAVGSIVQDYDSDKQFPALGFGGKLPNGTVSHEFFLNGNPASPFCSGIDGVVQAYQAAIRTVELWGPTNFAPVINHVARFASAIQDGSNYFILLIITDGVITDMPQTKAAIVEASFLPMSIIIVGVGGADFEAMEELDADRGILCSGIKRADRDIVQFVPLRDFANAGDPGTVQALLAKEVLAEVPQQFLLYMRKRSINPPGTSRPVQ